MWNDLSVAADAPRSFAAALARTSAVVALSLFVLTCHSEPNAPLIPKSLSFSVQPSNGDAVTAIGPIQVSALDASGRVLSGYSGQVTISLGVNPGGATLGGTKTVNAAAGVATFSTLTINRPGTGYVLAASSSGVTQNSQAFNITTGPNALVVFNVQPSDAAAGVTIAPTIQVTVQDAAGNTITSYTGNVTMTIGTNPAGGTLSGTATQAATAGVASFSGLSIDKAGTGYKLTATAGAGSGQSNPFNIIAASATQLVFTTQPVQTAAGSSIAPAVVVTAEDQFGNTASFTNQVAIAITHNTGNAAATLSGTLAKAPTNGVATFTDLSIDSVATGYTLSATATGLVGAFASATFNIVPGAASRLVFTGQPSPSTKAGDNIAPAITVTARDAKGNKATGFTGNVAMAITPNTGTAGAALSGTTPIAAAAGVATFTNLHINTSGAGYTITASSSGLIPDTSSAFSITPGTATKVAFTAQPSASTIAGQSIGAVKVTAQDSLGNADTAFAGSVTVTITAATGTANAHLFNGGPVAITAHTGTATLSTLSIDSAGASYTLSATATGGLTGSPSNAFNIRPGVATQLAFTVQPVTTIAGVSIAPAIQVTGRDAFGNKDTSYNHSITLSLSTNPGSATIQGATQAASHGVATFASATIKIVANGYRMSASDGTISSTSESNQFNITPAAASMLVFTVQPQAKTTAGQTLNTVEVAAEDPNGNIDTSFTGTVTLALAANPGGGGLGGTLVKVSPHGVGGGVVTFNDLSITIAQTGYHLQATSGSLAQGQSDPFTIVAAAATQLAFIVQPDAIVIAGGNFHAPTGVRVAAEDQFGNIDSSFTGTINMTLAGPTSTFGAGTATSTAATGVASFGDLRIHLAGIDYTLHANFTGLVSGTSSQFDVRAAPADHLFFVTSPSDQIAGQTISPHVVVAARDTFDNLDSSFTAVITLSIHSGGPAGVLQNNQVAPPNNGLAEFTTFNVETAGGPRTLDANGGGITTPVASGGFTITAAAANHLEFTQQPTDVVAGALIAPTVTVTAKDQFENVDLAFDPGGTMTLAINSGPGIILTGATSSAIANGAADFASVSLDKVGSHTLTATATGPLTIVSSPFNVSAAATDHFTFTSGPSDAVAGVAINPAIVVEARDQFDNVATGFDGKDVKLTVNTGPGPIASGDIATASAGVATFGSVKINVAGSYKLDAKNAVLGDCPACTAGTSGSFTITPAAASQLIFVQEPTDATHGVAISPAVAVAAEDQFGNIVPTFTGTVTIKIDVNPGGGVLSGTLSQSFGNVTAGVATFADLSIDVAGTGYKLRASSIPALTESQSAAFNIN